MVSEQEGDQEISELVPYSGMKQVWGCLELFLLFLTLPLLGTSAPMPQGLQSLLRPPQVYWRARAGIAGGEEAPEKEWPWQVSLRMKYKREEYVLWKHICGGSLINPQWILTAASCFPNIKQAPSSYRIQLRQQHLYYEDNLLLISEIVVHSNFTFKIKGADIALIKLQEPVQFSSQVQPIKLPAASQDFSNTECWVTGWGYISIKESLPPPFGLRQLQVSVLDNHDCDQLYHKFSIVAESIRMIPEDMICAGESNRDICEEDSGDPLVCKVEDSWFQVGVASWVEKCGSSSIRPGVYTNVSKYLDWIQKKIQ
ncbi:tryptase-like [Trichosurus vulpecula]|uniref:tryptase-like n=1 Tax=Trichosurus vulpecula TaxID=9337 RepID=UPI00186B2729|nr:tryptase-like [Trichosurus vulpecula]